MRVSTLCFAHLQDYFGDSPFDVELPDGALLCDLVLALERREPRIQDLTRHCRFAIGEEYASLESALFEGAVVAVLPPMSGG